MAHHIEAKLFPVPTNREGSVQRQLDDALVKSLHEITQATEDTLGRIQNIKTHVIGMYQYLADNGKEEEITSSVITMLKVNVSELVDKCDKAKRDIKELQRACSDNMTKHLSRLAICPNTGELIHSCGVRCARDCSYCENIFPRNYNYVPGTL